MVLFLKKKIKNENGVVTQKLGIRLQTQFDSLHVYSEVSDFSYFLIVFITY